MKIIDKYKKIVIKIGSSSIIDPATKKIRSSWITSFCKDISKINKNLTIVYKDFPQDDPLQRCPSLRKAKSLLNWEPKVPLNKGLDLTIKYFRESIKNNKKINKN